MAKRELQISLIDTGRYSRLVEFVEEVDRHADAECDVALQEIVHRLRDDLLRMDEG